jgi:hypothetical protein
MPAQTVARIKRARILKDTVIMARWLLGRYWCGRSHTQVLDIGTHVSPGVDRMPSRGIAGWRSATPSVGADYR